MGSTFTYGVGGAGGCLSFTSNPYTLTSSIAEIQNGAYAFQARVYRQARKQYNVYEMHYLRDDIWTLMPIQPLLQVGKEPKMTVKYRQPTTLEFTLLDHQGILTPANLNSPYNFNLSGALDPVLYEARKILWRVGLHARNNIAFGLTPTSTLAPSAGLLTNLTNNTFADYTATTPSNTATFSPTSTATFDINVDLGSIQLVEHVALRFGSKYASFTLPAAVQVFYSSDNVNFTATTQRPVGGAGTSTQPAGDWGDDSSNGVPIEIAITDISQAARYVRFRITPTGSQTLLMDKLVVYGGNAGATIGANVFVGYLGDSIQITPEGAITCQATSTFKRLADNNELSMTPTYQNTDAADIAYSLLSSTAAWGGQSEYNQPLASSEIGWPNNSGLTGLKYPIWQSQRNSILGYIQELFYSAGWVVYEDYNGILQAFSPPSTQRVPDRVFIAAKDGNNDVRDCVRDYTGKDIRNTVEISGGQPSDGSAGGELVQEPASVAAFGPRRITISDPIASTSDIRKSIGEYILRDYAWRLLTFRCEIAPDFDTSIKQLHAMRAPARPSVYALSSNVIGDRRNQELWSLMSVVHHFSVGNWWGDAEYVPYQPRTSDAPNILTVCSNASGSAFITWTWTPPTDSHIVGYRLYWAYSPTGPWTKYPTNASFFGGVGTGNSGGIGGFTTGNQLYGYMTFVDDRGYETLPSITLNTLVGGGSCENSSDWQVTDLGAALIQSTGPDLLGYYTYQIYTNWTSPLNGTKRFGIHLNVDAIPTADPDDWCNWAIYDPSFGWSGKRVPAGLKWDRVTAGKLDWTLSFKTKTNLSGHRLYIKIWTSPVAHTWSKYGGDRGWCGHHGWPGNTVFVTL